LSEPSEAEKREAAFFWVVNVTGSMAKSEIGASGTLGLLAASYLLGVEKDCYQALLEISVPVSSKGGIDLVRKTEIRPIKGRLLKKRRLRTVATILSCLPVFDHLGSEEMLGMLTLLATLAPDGSTNELHQIVEPIVIAAAKRPDSWALLERVWPELCRLIEQDDAVTKEGKSW